MSNFVLVDTDVFSYLWQGRAVPATYMNALRGATPVLSFATVAEAHFGAISANWGEKKKSQLEAAMRPYVVALTALTWQRSGEAEGGGAQSRACSRAGAAHE